MSQLPPQSTMLLRPFGGTNPDGSYEVQECNAITLPWVSTTVYAIGVQVVGSDGKVYMAKVSNLVNVNPVGDSAVHWQNMW